MLVRFMSIYVISAYHHWGHRGHDRMVVGFITIYAISANHHLKCEFASDLRQVSGFLWFPPPIKLTATI